MKEEYITSIKKQIESGELKKTKTLSIEMRNLEEFKFKLNNNNGIVSVAELIDIRDFINNTLTNNAHIIMTIIKYDKKSPKYWGKLELENFDDRKYYQVCIELEYFMIDEPEAKEIYSGFYIPDNYSLANKLIKVYKNSGGNTNDIENNHCRDCACWEFKSKKNAQKLVNFIDKNYIIPKIKELKEYAQIKKMNWKEDKVDIEYKKKIKKIKLLTNAVT